jgi:hypothetical protein
MQPPKGIKREDINRSPGQIDKRLKSPTNNTNGNSSLIGAKNMASPKGDQSKLRLLKSPSARNGVGSATKATAALKSPSAKDRTKLYDLQNLKSRQSPMRSL